MRRGHKRNNMFRWVLLVIGVLLINIFSSSIKLRWDLTSYGVYTISERNREIIQDNDKTIIATLMLGDNIPASFQKA